MSYQDVAANAAANATEAATAVLRLIRPPEFGSTKIIPRCLIGRTASAQGLPPVRRRRVRCHSNGGIRTVSSRGLPRRGGDG
ncbi:hypothetical protein GCM10022243_39140 [Saccharothrix violaceirubra]